MPSPIVVTGSTTLVEVKATDFVYDNGNTAVVLLSSINSFGQMITVLDYDKFCYNGRNIKISTTKNVYFDFGSQKTISNPSGISSFINLLNNRGQEINLYPRLPTQWVIQQQAMTSELDPSRLGITLTGVDYKTLDAEIVAISTNLHVLGSTFVGERIITDQFIRTSRQSGVSFFPGFQGQSISTAITYANTVKVDTLVAETVNTNLLLMSTPLACSTLSTGVAVLSTLQTYSLGFFDAYGPRNGYWTLSSTSTLWNENFQNSTFRKDINNLYSTSKLLYCTLIGDILGSGGISSIAAYTGPKLSTLRGNPFPGLDSDTFSSFVIYMSNTIQNAPWLPGMSSISSAISYSASSLSVSPGVSTMFNDIRIGLSTVAYGPGLSTLSSIYSYGISSVACGPGVSSFSTQISSNASSLLIQYNEFITARDAFVFGISDINVAPGLSSLSTLLSITVSSMNQTAGLSSLSTVISRNMSTFALGGGVSSLRRTYETQSSLIDNAPGTSSLKTILFDTMSSIVVTAGLSSLSTVLTLGLFDTTITPGLSSISTTFGYGFLASGQAGISSMSTLISRSLSSINNLPGLCSFTRVVQSYLSTQNDVTGICTLNALVGPRLSSIGAGIYPANLSTDTVFVSTLRMWDRIAQRYATLNLSSGVLLLDSNDIRSFLIQPTSISLSDVSTFTLNVNGPLITSSVVGVSMNVTGSNEVFARNVSTFSVRMSTLVTDTVNLFDPINSRYGSIYADNGVFYVNGIAWSEFFNTGVSSLSTSVFNGLSSLRFINPNFAFLSTSLSRGLSTLNGGSGLSTLSTNIGYASTVVFSDGASTNSMIASTASVSSLSFFGPNSAVTARSSIFTDTLTTSTLNGNVGNFSNLGLPKIFVNTFRTDELNIQRVYANSTIVWSNVSTASLLGRSTIATNIEYGQDIFQSTLRLSSIQVFDTVTSEYYPLWASSQTLYYNNRNIQAPITSLVASNMYTSNIYASSVGPAIPHAGRVTTNEVVDVTQSTLGIWNRTIIRNANTDVIQYSYDGINWFDTNFAEATLGGFDAQEITKPSFNGVYWLTGRLSDINRYSVLYSSDGITYNKLEQGQFTTNAFGCTWNGQYWLAGDYNSGGNLGTIRRSFDGITWTPNETGGMDGGARNFGWNGTTWIAVGNSADYVNSIQYSYDGVNWSNTAGESNDGFAVCWTGKLWIEAGAGATFGLIYSTDGMNWIGVDNLCNAFNFYDVKWNGKIAVAVGYGNGATSNRCIAYSENGINWRYGSGYDFSNAANGVAWNGEKWVATGYNITSNITIAYSYDGINWLAGPASGVPQTGQAIGFSSNCLPSIETPTLSIYSMGNGYIPLFLTSTNNWQVTPSSIIMNDSVIINRELGSDRRVGINTMLPSTAFDVNGSIQVNNSSFSFQLGQGVNPNVINPTNLFLNGSTFTSQLTILRQGAFSRQGVLDVYLGNSNYATCASNIYNQSYASYIMSNQAQGGVSMFPTVNTTDSGLYYLWNNKPNTNLFSKLTGTAVPFTGQHGVEVDGITQETVSNYVGLIVKSADRGYVSYDLAGKRVNGVNAIQSTEALPYVEIVTEDSDKAVFGVISDKYNIDMTYNADSDTSAYANNNYVNSLFGRLLVNSVGDGGIWVTNINGPIKAGDYICSSYISGHGRKQDSQCMANYTVANATMSCASNPDSPNYVCEPIEWNGHTYMRAFIGCTYHCG